MYVARACWTTNVALTPANNIMTKPPSVTCKASSTLEQTKSLHPLPPLGMPSAVIHLPPQGGGGGSYTRTSHQRRSSNHQQQRDER